MSKKRKTEKMQKKRQIYPFWAIFRTPRGYLGHKIGIAECPIVIVRYMQNFIEILREVFERFEVFQKVGIGKKQIHRRNIHSK